MTPQTAPRPAPGRRTPTPPSRRPAPPARAHPQPKIDPAAQAAAEGASRIWGSDLHATGKGRAFRAGGLLKILPEEPRAYGSAYTNKCTCAMRFLMIGAVHAIFFLYAYR